MALRSIATKTPPPVFVLEIPQTPKKRPGGAVHQSQHQPPNPKSVSVVITKMTADSIEPNSSGDGMNLQRDSADTASMTPTAAACDSDVSSPHRQQQPYVQHNIDRYFTPQPASPTLPNQSLPAQTLPQQTQSFQSDQLVLNPPVDSKDSNHSVSEYDSSVSGSNNNNDHKPQKENVPNTTTLLPSSKNGQQRSSGGNSRQNSTARKGTSSRPTARRNTGKSQTTRTQRKQPSGQKSSQQKLTSDVDGGVVKTQSNNDNQDEDKDVKRITDFFQLRRSHRRTKGEMIKCKQMLMEEKVLHADETGFQIVKFEDKGRGVISNANLKAGDFVLEYAGDLIDLKEARRREELYVRDAAVGCYMYYFQHENTNHCIDATLESDRLGRLINHSIRSANLKTKSVTIGGIPRLIFVAKRDIIAGEELLYDYGDRSKTSLQSHPWLKN
ncbi:N-lysine methyltransferase KMT5A-B-like [Varroa jacobsoni]|uniref:N-lysine methyltransferase KMT5A-B-like n=1 Tax=Varroa jacobsoni TaxID=62625 RepID=UPI000BF68018|nr:N-lysine methyltransferase KMT5A-B-like [Varroa jacobsoni]